MIKKVDHFVLTSTDFGACALFYEKLGFAIVDKPTHLELFAGDFKINVHLKGAELFPHATQVCVGSGDVCFEVDDLDGFLSNIQKNGIESESGIVARIGTNGPMRSAYIRDHDGNLLEFCSYAQCKK